MNKVRKMEGSNDILNGFHFEVLGNITDVLYSVDPAGPA